MNILCQIELCDNWHSNKASYFYLSGRRMKENYKWQPETVIKNQKV